MREQQYEDDLLKLDIACLRTDLLRPRLVSTKGSHCDVWKTSHREMASEEMQAPYNELVIKYPLRMHTQAEIRMLARHYQILKSELGEIIPDAVFVQTCINDVPNICVVARAVNIWFNISHPQNKDDAIRLLMREPRALDQLRRFVRVAESMRYSDKQRLIDLYGTDNLIMDNNREIRYIDNFYVFFYEDMLDMFRTEDQVLVDRINSSIERLEYLKRLMGWVEAAIDKELAEEITNIGC